jgi:hypothetical protein
LEDRQQLLKQCVHVPESPDGVPKLTQTRNKINVVMASVHEIALMFCSGILLVTMETCGIRRGSRTGTD